MLVVALAASLALLHNRKRGGRVLLSVELAGFLIMNGVYLARDGAAVRFFAGEYSSPTPLLCTCAGLLARLYAQSLLARRKVASSPI